MSSCPFLSASMPPSCNVQGPVPGLQVTLRSLHKQCCWPTPVSPWDASPATASLPYITCFSSNRTFLVSSMRFRFTLFTATRLPWARNGDCYCEEMGIPKCPGNCSRPSQPTQPPRPSLSCQNSLRPRPQAHLIIHRLGKDLELALCGEEGAVIGASLKGGRAGGMVSSWAPP